MKCRIHESFCDLQEVVCIAVVESPDGMTADQVKAVIDDAWDDFKSYLPDSDSQFGKWLANHYGFTLIDDDFADFTVEG